MRTRVWSNLFSKVLWAEIFNFRPSMFETARFTACKSPRPGQVPVDFPFEQETFCPSLPYGQGPRQAVPRLNL